MKSTFCPLPWIHLATMPDGYVPLCCNSDHTDLNDVSRNFNGDQTERLQLGKHTVSEIFNSDYNKKVRQEFLASEVPVACQGCFKKEAQGIESKRVASLKEFNLTEEEARNQTAPDGAIIPKFEYLEFRLGNACNLACVTCNPSSSSLWTKEYAKLQSDLEFIPIFDIDQRDFMWHEKEEFWKDLSAHTNGVHSVYINGGEPLISKKHIRFLENLDSSSIIKYNTNSTIITDDIIKAWSKFKKVIVNLSIDDLGDRNDYIRYKSEWSHLLSVCESINSLDCVEVNITQTVSIFNIYYIKEFKEYFNSLGINSHFNFVTMPEFLDPGIIPDRARDVVLKKHQGEPYISELEKHLNLFNDSRRGEKENLFSQFEQYYQWLDNSRNNSFPDTFPEWYAILKD